MSLRVCVQKPGFLEKPGFFPASGAREKPGFLEKPGFWSPMSHARSTLHAALGLSGQKGHNGALDFLPCALKGGFHPVPALPRPDPTSLEGTTGMVTLIESVRSLCPDLDPVLVTRHFHCLPAAYIERYSIAEIVRASAPAGRTERRGRGRRGASAGLADF